MERLRKADRPPAPGDTATPEPAAHDPRAPQLRIGQSTRTATRRTVRASLRSAALVCVVGAGLAASALDCEAALPPPDPQSGLAQQDYRIGPLDELDVVVFQEKDMSQTVDVDASGRINLPLVGALIAAGKSPDQLAKEIAQKLGEKYLQSPQVAVLVKKATSQKVIVDGEVGQPGVYPITGRTTLLQAIALAKGADQYADRKHVTIFRFVNSQRYSEVYNLDEIRRAKAPDPEIFGNDVVVVERSGIKSAIRDYFAPLSPLGYIIPHF